MSLLGVLRDTVHLYRILFWRSLLVTAAVFLVLDFLSALADRAPDYALATTAFSVGVLTVIGDLLVEGVLAVDVLDVHEGRHDGTLRGALRRTRPAVPALVGVSVVSALGVAAGFALLVLPGVLLLARWSLVAPIAVIERRGVVGALEQSNALVRGQTLRVLVVVVALLVVSSPVEALFDEAFVFLPEFYAEWLGGAAASAITTPFAAHALAVLYYRLADPDRPVVPARPYSRSVASARTVT